MNKPIRVVSVFCLLLFLALLLRISDQARRPAPRLDPVDDASGDSESTQVVKLR